MNWDDAQRKLIINAHMLTRFREPGRPLIDAARRYARHTLNPVPTHVRMHSGKTYSLEHVPRYWENLVTTPGPCGDPECPVLHTDIDNPIHPPDYVDSRTIT